jgi:hypothetical protein
MVPICPNFPQLTIYLRTFFIVSLHICAYSFHVMKDFFGKLVLLKQSLQLSNKSHFNSPFCFKKINCDMFQFLIQGLEINDVKNLSIVAMK